MEIIDCELYGSFIKPFDYDSHVLTTCINNKFISFIRFISSLSMSPDCISLVIVSCQNKGF